MSALDEKHQHAQRSVQADVVALGLVRAIVRTTAFGESNLATLQMDVEEMLRGVVSDLPEGTRRVLLPLSPEQEERVTNRIIGRRAVLFLRWVTGKDPPYRWHLTCASTGVAEQTRGFLEARRAGAKRP